MLTKLWGLLLSPSGSNRTNTVKKLTKLQQAQIAVNNLREVTGFNPIKAGQQEFSCSDNNIAEFYERIDAYYSKMVDGRGLTPQACFCELKEVNLDRFFTHNNAYVDQRALKYLTDICDKLIQKIQEGLKKDDSDAVYAERLLGKTFTSIIELEKAVSKSL